MTKTENTDASSPAWPDLAGRLVGDNSTRHHIIPVRVYFEDTDAGGVAYHASYVRWCERGRTDLLRLLGTDARRMIDGSDNHEPAAFVVRRMTFDFKRPAQMDDVLEIETRVGELGAASVTLHQSVTRAGQVLCQADVLVVLVSVSGKPLRISERVRAEFLTTQQITP
ncbi:MAG: YbgC/FadM family acyl-CoA thioesterase [Alphaproteobacteria bacterium]|nr:YbgC/FadM family acyl-CoA thioesterase [Alphaproteobacteria bacterium]